MIKYELHALNLPKMSGILLKLFTAVVENPIGKAFLINGLLENGGIPKLRKINLQEPPTMFPLMTDLKPIVKGELLFNHLNRIFFLKKNPPKISVHPIRMTHHPYKRLRRKLLKTLNPAILQQIPLRAFSAFNAEEILTASPRFTKKI